MRRSLTLLLSLTALAALATQAQARHPASAAGYSVQLESPGGGSLATYYHQGSTYVLGHYGNRYNIRVTNHTGRRVEAVVTVDGRDAISGEQGDYTRHRGYIIEPHGSVTVEGFRTNLSDVAAFRFTSPGDSYAGRRGTAQNVGVIGVAVFPERRHRRRIPQAVAPTPPPRRPWYGWNEDLEQAPRADRRPGNKPAPAPAEASGTVGDLAFNGDGGSGRTKASAKRRTRGGMEYDDGISNLGTRYGEQQYSPVVEVPFQRASKRSPARVLAIYYDNAEGLARRGITAWPRYSGEPSPFPNRRFAPPPPR